MNRLVLNNENEVIRPVSVKLIDELKARDPVTRSGLEFFAGSRTDDRAIRYGCHIPATGV